MDYVYPVVTIVQISAGLVMTILLIRVYLKNHYLPTALLGLFWGIFSFAFLVTTPIFFIPNTPNGEMLAIFLQDISVVSIFLMFAVLIMAFEGMKGWQILSPISTIFIALTAVAVSLYVTVIRIPSMTFNGIWWSKPNDMFDILFVGFVFSAVIIILVRLIQYTRHESSGKEKRMTIIALSGFLATIVGGIGTYLLEIPNMDYLFVTIGIVILAAFYIKHPHSFFLSHTRINAIMLINTPNKIPFLVIGDRGDAKGSSYALVAAGLGGIMMLLQEILGSERPPTRLYHKDKGILLEHDFEHEISGVIVADQVNDVLRSPLKHALSRFAKKFEKEIVDWVGEVSIFQVFERDLRDIFKFAFTEPGISVDTPKE